MNFGLLIGYKVSHLFLFFKFWICVLTFRSIDTSNPPRLVNLSTYYVLIAFAFILLCFFWNIFHTNVNIILLNFQSKFAFYLFRNLQYIANSQNNLCCNPAIKCMLKVNNRNTRKGWFMLIRCTKTMPKKP